VYVAILTSIGYGPSLVWCWYVSRRWGSRRLGADVGLRFRWSDAGWGPVIWIAALVAQIAVAALIIVLDVPLTSNTERISDIDANRAYVIALAVTAVVAAPLVEEMVFRGVVMRLASPARRNRDRHPSSGVLRCSSLRPGARHRQHRPRDGVVVGRRRLRPRRLLVAQDRAHHRRPRDLQWGRADHRAHRSQRPRRLRFRWRRHGRAHPEPGDVSGDVRGAGISGGGRRSDTGRGRRVDRRSSRR